MNTLALAGGTSASLGRAIVSAILANQQSKSWNIVILSRSTRTPTWLRALDPEAQRHTIKAVDYASISSLASALEGVHTVISVTGAYDGSQAQTQINLLDAAVKAGCKRFAPSQYGFGRFGWKDVPSLAWMNQGVSEACGTRKGEIEISYFNQGAFMEYLGIGMYPVSELAVDEGEALKLMGQGGGYMFGEDSACAGLQRLGPLGDGSGAYLLGLRNGIAELPVKADGQWPRITLTSLRDVGRFVAAALDLPKWEEDMDMVGDTLTMGELLRHAEEVTGKSFEVQKLDPATIERKMASLQQDDYMGILWSEFNFAYTRDGDDEVVLRPVLNQLCPEVRPIGVRAYLAKYWVGVR